MANTEDLPQFVNVFGKEIPVELSATGGIMVPLSEVSKIGFKIYKKETYSQLLTTQKQFTKEFDLYLVAAAEQYMIDNRQSFTEQEILESINRVKKMILDMPENMPNSQQLEAGFGNRPDVIETPKSRPRVAFEENLTQEPVVPLKQSPLAPSTCNVTQPPKEVRINKTFPAVAAQHRLQVNKVYDVTVTAGDEQTAYVRLNDNEASFDAMHTQLQEANGNSKLVTKYDFHKIYAAEHEHCWLRCKILKTTPLTVFFIDYGLEDEVENLKEIPDNLQMFPSQAIKVHFMGYEPETDEFDIKIKVLSVDSNGEYVVEIPRSPHNPVKYFIIPELPSVLETGLRVRLDYENDLVLYVRTRDMIAQVEQIDKEIETIAASGECLQDVQRGQLIICKNEQNKYSRAKVLDIKGTKMHVNFLDDCVDGWSDKNCARQLTDSLSKMPLTFHALKLKNLRFSKLNEKCMDFIKHCIDTRRKFTVTYADECDFDLTFYDENNEAFSFVEKLKSLYTVTTNGKMYFRDMEVFKPSFGVDDYMLSVFKTVDNFTLVSSDELGNKCDNLMIKQIMDSTPYKPDIGEVCLGIYQGPWCRCVALSQNDDKYNVKFIDFGNTDTLSSDMLRKLTIESKLPHYFGLTCKLINLPSKPNVESLIGKLFLEGEFYSVDIKSLDGDKYEIEVPEVYCKIK